MTIDVTSLNYSDAVRYLEDYLSEAPIFGLTEDDFYCISLAYNLDTSCIAKENQNQNQNIYLI